MRLTTLCITTLFAIGAIGMAHAGPVNLITNGSFSATSPTKTIPTQFGADSGPGFVEHKNSSGNIVGTSCGQYGGNFITGWTGNSNNYEIWYPNAKAASGTNPCTKYNSSSKTDFPQRLSTKVTAPPLAASPTGSFIGMDGITSPLANASVSQTVTGLTSGDSYTVSFWWGNSQLQNRKGYTTEQLQVFVGGSSAPVLGDTPTFSTEIVGVATQAFSGWTKASFNFTADSSSTLLSFLSVGTPNSLPPFAVLTGVSMYQNIKVPEPSDLAMLGGGLFGLGMLIMLARRREIRRRDADGHSTII